MTSRRSLFLLAVVLLAGALAYLRDPTWLIDLDSGFRPWERAADGTRFRWTSGHASFFVAADHSSVVIPIRVTAPDISHPTTVTVAIDDRPAAAAQVWDGSWHRLMMRLPAKGSRRVRRIDIRVDRVQSGNRGVAVGEVELK